MVTFTKEDLYNIPKLQRQQIISEEKKQQQLFLEQEKLFLEQQRISEQQYQKDLEEYNRQKAVYDLEQQKYQQSLKEQEEWKIATTFVNRNPQFIGFLPESIKVKARQLQNTQIANLNLGYQSNIVSPTTKQPLGDIPILLTKEPSATRTYEIRGTRTTFNNYSNKNLQEIEQRLRPQVLAQQIKNLDREGYGVFNIQNNQITTYKTEPKKEIPQTKEPLVASLPSKSQYVKNYLYKKFGVDIPSARQSYERLFGERFKYGLSPIDTSPLFPLSLAGYGIEALGEGAGKVAYSLAPNKERIVYGSRTVIPQKVTESKEFYDTKYILPSSEQTSVTIPYQNIKDTDFLKENLNIKGQFTTPESKVNVKDEAKFLTSLAVTTGIYSVIPPILSSSIYTTKSLSVLTNPTLPTEQRIFEGGFGTVIGGMGLGLALREPKVYKLPTEKPKTSSVITIKPSAKSGVFEAKIIQVTKTPPRKVYVTNTLKEFLGIEGKTYPITTGRTDITLNPDALLLKNVGKNRMILKEPAVLFTQRVGAKLQRITQLQKGTEIKIGRVDKINLEAGLSVSRDIGRFSPSSKTLTLKVGKPQELTGGISLIKKVPSGNKGTQVYISKSYISKENARSTYDINSLIFVRGKQKTPEGTTRTLSQQQIKSITKTLTSGTLDTKTLKNIQASETKQATNILKPISKNKNTIITLKPETKQIQQQVTQTLSKQKSETIPLTKTKQIPSTKTIIISEGKPTSRLKELTLSNTKSFVSIKPQTKQIQQQQTKQLTSTTLKLNTQQTKQIPQTIPTRITIKPKPSTEDLPKIKETLPNLNAFKVLVKRRGKFQTVSGSLPRGKALKLGVQITKSNLGATFKLLPSGQTTQTDISFTPSKEFRSYRISQGRIIPLQDEFIQRRGYRLSSRGEVSEILSSKRSKGRLSLI